jgi:hypothetical protein
MFNNTGCVTVSLSSVGLHYTFKVLRCSCAYRSCFSVEAWWGIQEMLYPGTMTRSFNQNGGRVFKLFGISVFTFSVQLLPFLIEVFRGFPRNQKHAEIISQNKERLLFPHNLHDSLFTTICIRSDITRNAASNKLKDQHSVEFTFGGRGGGWMGVSSLSLIGARLQCSCESRMV